MKYYRYYKYFVYDWLYAAVPEDEGHFWLCHLQDRWRYVCERTWKGIRAQIEMLRDHPWPHKCNQVEIYEIGALEALVVCGPIDENKKDG